MAQTAYVGVSKARGVSGAPTKAERWRGLNVWFSRPAGGAGGPHVGLMQGSLDFGGRGRNPRGTEQANRRGGARGAVGAGEVCERAWASCADDGGVWPAGRLTALPPPLTWGSRGTCRRHAAQGPRVQLTIQAGWGWRGGRCGRAEGMRANRQGGEGLSLTVIDRNTALIVVDLQKGIAAYAPAAAFAEVVARTRALLKVFRQRGLPVVLVNVTGRAPGRTEIGPLAQAAFPEGWSDLLPELEARSDDILVTKQSWGAFAATGLEERLKARGVTQVVVTGVATSVGCEATARQAYELGFNVTLAIDAMTDRDADAHDYSIRHVFPRLGETGTSGEIIALIERSA